MNPFEYVVELGDNLQLSTSDVDEAAEYSRCGYRVRARRTGGA